MSRKSPYVTLAGAAGVFLTLIAVNMASGPGDGPAYPAAASSTSSASAPPSSDEPDSPSSASTGAASSSSPNHATGRSAPAFPSRAVYAGHTAHAGPAVAIAILGGSAAAYFCDGIDAESWMTGWARRGALALTGSHRDSLQGRLSHGVVSGTVTVHGRTYGFKVSAANAPAGLYRAQSSDGRTTVGWIVLRDGSQVGIRTERRSTAPAPTLQPGSRVTVAGQDVVPRRIHGDERF